MVTWRRLASLVLTTCLATWTGSASGHAVSPPRRGDCRYGVIAGEVNAGEGFERPIGNGLKIFLEPLRSGWLLRVLPSEGPRGEHDYAELATLPYRSVSPLLVSTDFSFRAQDAVAWNPRRFRFVADEPSFTALLAAYQQYQKVSQAGLTANRDAKAAESRLVSLAARTAEGELTIVDAHLEEGIGNEGRMASAVALHPNLAATEAEQPSSGRVTPLGQLNWIRFRIRLALTPAFHPERGLRVEYGPCSR
jgi:hypothetical protein